MSPPPASPLASPLFRALWLATIVSNIGTWMHDIGASWLMTSLSPSPLMVALVQSATTLPIFLFALPGGALADIVDRRRLLVAAQLWSLAVAALLAGLTLTGVTGPGLLLALTFALSCGSALSAPAFQATVPELVPPASIPQAVALNSLGVNIARAIGPALGGLIVALSGPAAVFALNAVSVLGIVAVLLRWRRQKNPPALPAEHFIGALRSGLRYALRAPDLQAVLVRSLGFFLFASAPWSLLPLIARRDLGLGAGGYGGLLAFVGLGAVAGAIALPRIRRRLSANVVTVAATLMFAAMTALLAAAHSFAAAAAALLGAGIGWIAMMSSLNAAAQLATAPWVKARALALYLLVFQGSMTAGAAFWGWVASQAGIPTALLCAAAALGAASILARRFAIPAATADLAPSLHWPSPETGGEIESDRGPVMVTIEYRVEPARAAAFARAMAPLQRIRRRDGALAWGLYEDASAPGTIIEYFIVESWLEHLRQHARVTNADRAEQDLAGAFHLGPEPPLVRHWIAPA
ncbi:MFS transporter [Sphingomonas deserti]|uniref:MFS transporter n=1 Tax=Allosphingosinicella deserti TaxID=2116704 RepID=A0A2P7QSR4_9SPHN|nr:MFS transporter [Sphingomonas deserti]